MIRILVTGVGSLLGQGILKSIQNSKLDCHIIGTDYFSSAVGLYWVNKGYLLPDILRSEISETQWVESLIDIINKEKINIVLPGLDFEIPILARNKSTIEKQTGVVLVVSSKEIVTVADDKWETVKYLKDNNFHYPESSLPDAMHNFLHTNSFPLIVKPRFGHTSENVFIVKNKSQLHKAIQKCEKPIIQEYLGDPDKEYTCGATCVDSEIVTLISLRRTLKNGNTQQAFCEKTDEIDAYVRKLTLSLKPYGPINFQLRLTDRGPVVFEINPRFSGTTPIRALFGVNEVEAVINKFVGKKNGGEYKEREGIVIRYFENQFISLDQYKAYLS
ncbi:MAG: ATP-grasp domain-containing protein [Bacteroidetes bacterium]|jgi:carbamoyl-phosphate synthase large subunit|nr:ATP-grasp domain-containing protein [Bacteroidota bacterium]